MPSAIRLTDYLPDFQLRAGLRRLTTDEPYPVQFQLCYTEMGGGGEGGGTGSPAPSDETALVPSGQAETPQVAAQQNTGADETCLPELLTLDGTTGWSGAWENMYSAAANGGVIDYTVKEVTPVPDGWTSTVESSEDAKTWTFTNTAPKPDPEPAPGLAPKPEPVTPAPAQPVAQPVSAKEPLAATGSDNRNAWSAAAVLMSLGSLLAIAGLRARRRV